MGQSTLYLVKNANYYRTGSYIAVVNAGENTWKRRDANDHYIVVFQLGKRSFGYYCRRGRYATRHELRGRARTHKQALVLAITDYMKS